MTQNRQTIIQPIVEELLCSGSKLKEEQANELAAKLMADGEEALVFLLLELSRYVKIPRNPIKPSGMIPPFQKASKQTAKKKPGGQKGHQGSSRLRPPKIDKQETHHLDSCPQCGGPFTPCNENSQRPI